MHAGTTQELGSYLISRHPTYRCHHIGDGLSIDGVTGYSTDEQHDFGPTSMFFRTLPEFVVDHQTRGRLRDWVPVDQQRLGVRHDLLASTGTASSTMGK